MQTRDDSAAHPDRHVARRLTDGLIEQRTEAVDVGIQRLRDAIGDAKRDVDPETFCAELASRLTQPDEAADDAAIITIEFTA